MQLATVSVPEAVGAYVEPFFVLIRSAISRFSARFGSKFCGSQAFTIEDC